MRKAVNYVLLGFIAMLIILYALGWYDLIENKMLTGDVMKDLKKSFKDYFGVLYYFRYIIFVGTIILALIFYGVRIGIEKLRG